MLKRPMPSLISIRAFEAAARLGTFTLAGRELGTSSASVSYHIRRLEDQLGVRLFIRFPHRVELTEAGAEIARQAATAFDALRASFAKAITLEEGRLSLTVPPSFGASWLTPRIGGFRSLHPEIHVNLEISSVTEDLSAGRFDAAIRNGSGNWPGLRSIELFPSVYMPLCVPSLLGKASELTDLRQELSVPLLGRKDLWSAWYSQLGHNEPLSPSLLGTTLAAEHLDVAAALAGHGIVIASPILCHNEISAGRLVPAHDMVLQSGHNFWFVYPVSSSQSRKISAFREWIMAEASTARNAAICYTNDR